MHIPEGEEKEQTGKCYGDKGSRRKRMRPQEPRHEWNCLCAHPVLSSRGLCYSAHWRGGWGSLTYIVGYLSLFD